MLGEGGDRRYRLPSNGCHMQKSNKSWAWRLQPELPQAPRGCCGSASSQRNWLSLGLHLARHLDGKRIFEGDLFQALETARLAAMAGCHVGFEQDRR